MAIGAGRGSLYGAGPIHDGSGSHSERSWTRGLDVLTIGQLLTRLLFLGLSLPGVVASYTTGGCALAFCSFYVLPYRYPTGRELVSSVLCSDGAVQVNIEIMRAFGRLWGLVAAHTDLARRLDELETKTVEHDTQFRAVFEEIRRPLLPASTLFLSTRT